MTVRIEPDETDGVDRIAGRLSEIRSELDSLAGASGPGDGVGDFAVETIRNMVRVIDESLGKLPRGGTRAEGEIPSEITVQLVPEERAEAGPAPRKIRGAARNASPAE